MLKKIGNLSFTTQQKALHRIEGWKGVAVADTIRGKLGLPTVRSEWPELLAARRQLAGAPLDEEEEEEYEKEVRKDRRQVRRKVLCPEYKGKHGTLAQDEREEKEVVDRCGPLADVASNDVGLPAPQNLRARMLEQWCKRTSWGMCEQCSSMQPRPLQPMDLKRALGPTISAKKCTACSKGEYVPQLQDIPEALRGLTKDAIEALRPLEIDTGRFVRATNGYRVHSSMISFAWAPIPIKEKVRALACSADRHKAREALEFLLDCGNSEYNNYYERHAKFLEKKGADAALRSRRRPLRFIEQSGAQRNYQYNG